MRKALIGILLAAGVSMPSAAWAQEAEEAPPPSPRQQRAIQHYERLEQRNQQRFEQRQERRERQQAVQSRQEQVANRHDRVADHRDRSRSGNGDPWLGDPNDPRMERHRRRYERLEQQNAERSEDRQNRERWDRHRRADRRWDRSWRNDRRYDWYGYRNRYRDNYRLGRYYDPFGSGYRRFSIGIQIGRPFYSQRYWINDPWQYRLPRAYPGTQWVRYYDDVLLVDTWSGEVLDVIYNFFW